MYVGVWPNTWSILENILCALKKMCILLFWDGMFQIYLLSLSGLMCVGDFFFFLLEKVVF